MTEKETITFARNSIAKGSHSFARSAKIFDRKTREKAWLFYAWCRRCDDITDGQDHGYLSGADNFSDSQQAAEQRVKNLKEMTQKALNGEAIDDPAFICLALLHQHCPLPENILMDIITGFELDAADWRPRSTDDLLKYCYYVAGAVGIIMAIIMGVAPDDDKILDHACDMGIALQLTNIARDIADDARMDRCYLPIEWLVENDMAPGQHVKPHNREKLVLIANKLRHLAQCYEQSARYGANALPWRSRWAVMSALSIYMAISDELERKGTAAWDSRASTSSWQKLRIIIGEFLGLRKSAPPYYRGELWQRPL